MATTPIRIWIYYFCFIQLFSATTSAMFLTLKNSCVHTTWPAILSKPGSPGLPKTTTGFVLQPDESKRILVPPEWAGSLWGRTLCVTGSDGNFSCVTGDCGSGAVECGSGGESPFLPPTTTLADFTPVAGTKGQYMTYFVSLLEGYNMPMTVVPIGGTGRYCRATGCIVDLNRECPEELTIMYGNESVGCNYGPAYSSYFESSCPRSHTSVSDKTSTFGCLSAVNYDVTFCASNFPPTKSPATHRPSPPDGYDTQNQELNKKKSKLTLLILGSLGGSTVTVILLVALVCKIKLVIRRRSRTSEIELGFALGTSSSA